VSPNYKKNIDMKIYAKHIKSTCEGLERCMLKCQNRLRLVQLSMTICVIMCQTELVDK